ncbi:MAG: methyltransferase, TIGR04325 family [Candidatus Parcubacteria bacterium]|nr:methyltransferase, TIGR04325 family [Burkholderiales bacterium]
MTGGLAARIRGRVRQMFRGPPPRLFSGSHARWADALQASGGYSATAILDKARAATRKVVSGEAAFERDTVLFSEPKADEAKLGGLRRAASAGGGRLSVVDFGGALGSAYHQNRRYLDLPGGLRWSVVEQAHFVRCGQQEFQTDELRFYDSLQDCVDLERPNVALLSGVLSYLELPLELLRQVAQYRVPFVLIDRTATSSDGKTRLTVQNVAPEIYDASYPCWIFDRQAIVDAMGSGYELFEDFESGLDAAVGCDWGRVSFRGMFFRLL